MKFACHLAILITLVALMSTVVVAETVNATFADGKGHYRWNRSDAPVDERVTDVVDAYSGKAGDGWTDGWIAAKTDGSTSIELTALGSGDDGYSELADGNYLNFHGWATGTARHAAIARDYSDGINTTEDMTMEFTVRINEDLTNGNFASSSDRYHIHDRVFSETDTSLTFRSTTDTFSISIYGDRDIGETNVDDHWVIYDFNPLNKTFVDTGITATQGVEYDFALSFDMSAGTYGVSIIGSDASSYSGSGFIMGPGGGLSGHETTGRLAFSTLIDRASSDPGTNHRDWDIDAIKITQVPEPATLTLLLGMMLAFATLRRRS